VLNAFFHTSSRSIRKTTGLASQLKQGVLGYVERSRSARRVPLHLLPTPLLARPLTLLPLLPLAPPDTPPQPRMFPITPGMLPTTPSKLLPLALPIQLPSQRNLIGNIDAFPDTFGP
jgi:hypothetical protein